MNVHTVAVLFIFLGLAFVGFCVVEAEVCYRRLERYLAEQAAQRAVREAAARGTAQQEDAGKRGS
jgi:hypothetical protein